MLKSNFVTTVTRLRLVVQNYTRAVVNYFVQQVTSWVLLQTDFSKNDCYIYWTVLL